MPRIIVSKAKGPAELKIGDKMISICRCGLTKDKHVLCDKSHRKAEDEDDSHIYVYQDDLSREIVDNGSESCCGEEGCDCSDEHHHHDHADKDHPHKHDGCCGGGCGCH